MPSTPWTIQRSKRKISVSEPPARKRVRISDDVNQATPATSRRPNQKTLTQIDFVRSHSDSIGSIEDDSDLQQISRATRRGVERPRTAPPKMKKQSSTLTQMPWLQDTNTVSESAEYDYPEEIGPNTSEARRILQLDGANSDTSITRPHKHALKSSLLEMDSKAGKSRKSKNGNREMKLKDRALAEDNAVSRRRRSGRIATKNPTIPRAAENGEERETDTTRNENGRPKTFHHPAPLLEIQDSTDLAEFQTLNNPTDTETAARQSTPPQQYIPSSQTPETRQQDTVRRLPQYDESPTKPKRTPLAERSTNIPANPRAAKHLKNVKHASPVRKVCVLKVPPRALLRRGSCLDDSQHDIYSLQGTSSPTSQDHVTHNTAAISKPASQHSSSPRDSAHSTAQDIPQTPSQIESQASLPQLTDLLPSRTAVETAGVQHQIEKKSFSQAAASDAVHVRNFGNHEAIKLSAKATVHFELDDMLLEGDPVGSNVFSPPSEDEEDLASYLSVQNDTQFNAELQQRTSSPIRSLSRHNSGEKWEDAREFATPKQNRRMGGGLDDSMQLNDDTPIPIPRLVARATPSVNNAAPQQGTMSVQQSMLPPAISNWSTNLQANKTPLNDNATTSPLPSSTQPIPSQKSIHPASMRHPSQISTQDPTQNYLPSSVAPSVAVTRQTQRILVKDSSEDDHFAPIHIHDTAQKDQLDPRVIGDSEDELDDLDLDPISTIPHSARKPMTCQPTESESSLKSIHISATPSSDHAQPPSSSPSLPGTTTKPTPQIKADVTTSILDLLADIPTSSSSPPPVSRARSPMAGFDNDTQSDFTQNGHVTAAYIHRQRDLGRYPKWFVPRPTVVAGKVGGRKSREDRCS